MHKKRHGSLFLLTGKLSNRHPEKRQQTMYLYCAVEQRCRVIFPMFRAIFLPCCAASLIFTFSPFYQKGKKSISAIDITAYRGRSILADWR